MPLLQPFRALRPPPRLAAELAVLPYDVVDREEARQVAADNPRSFFRVTRPELELPADISDHDPSVYALARKNLDGFIEAGWLVRDPVPSFFAYRLTRNGHTQLGLVAAASIDAYERGDIRRHEHTRADKETDRIRHVDALAANDEPVFLTYRGRRELDALVAEATHAPPLVDFVSDDGVGHAFWVIPGPFTARLQAAFDEVERLYVADGHHRSAAAASVRKLRRERGLPPSGDEQFLAVVFPHDQLKLLGYHRLVRDLHGLSPAAFLERCRARFDVDLTSRPEPSRPRELTMYLDGSWYRLTPRDPASHASPIAALDVTVLQENLLAPVLGVTEPRTDPRMAFVGGIRGTKELERRVDSGENAVAFALYPTRVDQMMAVADTGEVMPPKSTWFEPKLRSGLIVHPFD